MVVFRILSSTIKSGKASLKRFQPTTSSFRGCQSKSTTMATANKILLTVDDIGIVKYKPQTPETARRTSELLQENHEKHHTYFNTRGFHNHIVHGILTLYGLGAPTSVIETHYKLNASYQRPLNLPYTINLPVPDLKNPEVFKRSLGDEKNYAFFLEFFKKEIEEKGWEDVLLEYMFVEGERGDDLLGRMFETIFHPLIHLGFGIEFHQPAIIAEALAQACVHPTHTGAYLLSVERALRTSPSPQESPKTIKEILNLIHNDKKLSTAANKKSENLLFDGVLTHAREEMISYAKLYNTPPDSIPSLTHAMIQNSIYLSATPAPAPYDPIKIDFLLMHCATVSILFPSLLSLPFLTPSMAARLLNFKVWSDFFLYATRNAPRLVESELESYVPRAWKDGRQTGNGDGTEDGDGDGDGWTGVWERLFKYQEKGDDGHAVKLGRAVRYGEMIGKGDNSDATKSNGYGNGNREGEEEELLKGDMWLRFGHRVIDSAEDAGSEAPWIRPDM
ncbi:hypothetical protein HYFRA_00003635 [Hymenoscyphus fraxineus]|uniref:Oxidoreductase AflY n=1 Tax=Hymenoscyphus fraxineus TaxID=746836 RepID=A0A9N9PUJ3_9HELO|nr:hypothetical protein HYFRA_00003635 [Hymenoscyphus fraxineus]